MNSLLEDLVSDEVYSYPLQSMKSEDPGVAYQPVTDILDAQAGEAEQDEHWLSFEAYLQAFHSDTLIQRFAMRDVWKPTVPTDRRIIDTRFWKQPGRFSISKMKPGWRFD